MEGLTIYNGGALAVFLITDYWMSQITHMHTDLMSPAGGGTNFNQSKSFESFDYLVIGNG